MKKPSSYITFASGVLIQTWKRCSKICAFLLPLLVNFRQDTASPNRYPLCNNKKGSFRFCVLGTIYEISTSQNDQKILWIPSDLFVQSTWFYLFYLCFLYFSVCGTEHGRLRKPYPNHNFHREKTFYMRFFQTRRTAQLHFNGAQFSSALVVSKCFYHAPHHPLSMCPYCMFFKCTSILCKTYTKK